MQIKIYYDPKRERKQKELLAKLEIKYQSKPILILPLISMNISFSPGDIIPFKNVGTVYQDIKITDKWGSLSAKEAIVGRMWKKTVVSEPTGISDTLIVGNGWTIDLNKDWKLEKIDNNYTLKKK